MGYVVVCCAGWFCGGAASWVVGVSSFRHSMAVVWCGSFFVSSVVSVGSVMEGQLSLLWWDGVVSGKAPCGVCCCMLCVSWAEHWRLERMFVLMKVLVRFEWYIFGALMGMGCYCSGRRGHVWF